MTDNTPTPDAAERLAELLDRPPAQFFFEIGYAACWAEAMVRTGKPPFDLTDAIIERAWAIAGEAHDDHAEFERHKAAANSAPDPQHTAMQAQIAALEGEVAWLQGKLDEIATTEAHKAAGAIASRRAALAGEAGT